MSRRERLALIAVVALAAVLRLFGAGGELWFDEIVTLEQQVRRPVAEIVSRYEFANNHVMNSLLAHATVAALGESPLALRLPAIAFGIAGVAALFFAARELWSVETALAAAACFAASYPHVFYTQNARGYTAATFFTLTATAFLVRLLRRAPASAGTDGWGYAASIGLGLYALLLVAFVAIGHAAVLLAVRRWRVLAWLCAGVLLAAALYAPMSGDLVRYYTERADETGNPLLSAAFAQEIVAIVPALVVIAAAGSFVFLRLGRREPLIAALLAAPLAANVLLPLVHPQGVHPRSFIYALPFAYLLLGEAIEWSRRRSRVLTLAFVGVVIVASLAPLVRYYRLPKQPFVEALDYVAARRRAEEQLIGVRLAGKAARFYDASVPLVETTEDLHRRLDERRHAVWILVTFTRDLRRVDPEMDGWLARTTVLEATFPAAIDDGAVEVRRWHPPAGDRS